jgi:hypothetical protein
VGKSNTGKTTLSKELLASGGDKLPVKVVNDNTGDLTEYESISWEELETVKNCKVLIEDVISVDPKKFVYLQKLASFGCHHNNVPLALLVTHSIEKNNINGFLNYVSHVYFTFSKANVRSLWVILEFYKFTKPEKTKFSNMLFSILEDTFGYFVLDVENRTFKRLDDHVSESKPEKKKVTTFQ